MRVAPDRIVLTASSSESYALLFKLLCDPGDTVLVPRPSYPLFEHLTRLEACHARALPASNTTARGASTSTTSRATSGRSRPARILVVQPEQPDGRVAEARRADRLGRICARAHTWRSSATKCSRTIRSMPGPGAVAASIEQADVLTVSLGGLSKSAGLAAVEARMDGAWRSGRRWSSRR